MNLSLDIPLNKSDKIKSIYNHLTANHNLLKVNEAKNTDKASFTFLVIVILI